MKIIMFMNVELKGQSAKITNQKTNLHLPVVSGDAATFGLFWKTSQKPSKVSIHSNIHIPELKLQLFNESQAILMIN